MSIGSDRALVQSFVHFASDIRDTDKSQMETRLAEYLDFVMGFGSENFTVTETPMYVRALYDGGSFRLSCEFTNSGFVNVHLYITRAGLVDQQAQILYTKSWIKLDQPFIDAKKQKNIRTVIRRLLDGDKFDAARLAF